MERSGGRILTAWETLRGEDVASPSEIEGVRGSCVIDPSSSYLEFPPQGCKIDLGGTSKELLKLDTVLCQRFSFLHKFYHSALLAQWVKQMVK